MAEELGLAYLRAYLDSLALSSFKNGANFATGRSSIRKDKGYSPFHLDAQIAQFRQFKARTIDIVNSTQQEKGKADLPKPEDFSKALYTFDIGQNDLQFGLSTSEGARAIIPEILDLFSTAVQQLYSEAQEFNRQLKSKLAQLKANLTGAAFTYVDAYTAKYNLINFAKDQGFVDPLNFCCCPEKVVVNGTVYSGPCANPSTHISWDGIHYSEAANQWVAKFILNGSMSDPSIPINQACYA
ncbi:hypothetical protein MKW98_016328 [Papaver atlanticum]|uniref:GDSL esterase/lipase n=1 Tax=Papaver atlanticum TaxID=357466 RepID=A0AAD4SI39_9MAGN|nr:hypothetical protein MKW98_016328 [Papaver atlanticum]